jgi:quinol monooxygenase YgiN
MPTVIATVKLKADNAEEGKAFFRELAAGVRANDKDDPNTVVVYEKYESDAAFAEHGKNLASKGGEFAKYLDGPPDIVALEEI